MAEADAKAAKVAVKVWDIPVRLFHWALVICFVLLWLTGENGPIEWHARFGLAALALVAFRLIWGFVGGGYASFASFVRGPAAAIGYLKDTLAGRHRETLGHNPLGALSVLALLGAMATQAVLGLFSNDDVLFEGPLAHFVGGGWSKTLSAWHEAFFNVVLAVVAIHLLAVIGYAILLKIDLVRPMVTGTKKVPASEVPAEPQRTSGWVALPIAVLCAAAAWALWRMIP